MLTLHNATSDYPKLAADLAGIVIPAGTVWIDILDGTSDEIAYVARATGLHIPTLAELSEIENSSRLRSERGVLCMSLPAVSRGQAGMPAATSLGIILTRSVLVTVRFVAMTSFTTFTEEFCKASGPHASAAGAFIGLMNEMIDRAADILEGIGADLESMSQRIFRSDADMPSAMKTKRHRPAQADADLRDVLRKIGRSGDLISKIRDNLLGVERVVAYAGTMGAEWFAPELRAYLETQRHDFTSLSDYDAHLSNKVQLLLDATIGFINIEQNNIIKVLTVVSVVGVPPTLIASMYGMNFHNMPELSWAYGYPYGLTLIFISAVGPLLWFRLRGWL